MTNTIFTFALLLSQVCSDQPTNLRGVGSDWGDEGDMAEIKARHLLLIFGVTAELALLALVLFRGYRGQYSEITQTYWCTSEASCLHEIGHAADQRGQIYC